MVMSRSLFCVAVTMTLLALALCICSYSPADENMWTKKADMQTPRYHFSACAIDGKIYAIGGLSEGEGGDIPAFSTVERYDPKANRWTNVADMPTARFFPAASLANGKIYVMGGGTPQLTWPWNLLSTLEVYDPITDTWTKNTDMPTPRDRASASTLGGSIYVIGGADEANRAVSIMEKYDP
jgi:N-acetylneuraminic acid mutarotase